MAFRPKKFLDRYTKFEDLTYYLLLNKLSFDKLYYDVFEDENAFISISGSYRYDKFGLKYIINSTPCVFETDNIISGTDTYYRFLVHYESDVECAISYSLDDGNNWTDCNSDEIILIDSGYTKLRLKFTFNNTGEFNSFGIIYNYYTYQSSASNYKLFEVLNVTSNITHGTNIEIPHNGTYTTDGKSLEVYVNGRRMINNVDFNEVDNHHISFIDLDLEVGDEVLFVEQYAYIDISQENSSKWDNFAPSWTNNLADYILLRDQGNGSTYKLYFENDELKYEKI